MIPPIIDGCNDLCTLTLNTLRHYVWQHFEISSVWHCLHGTNVATERVACSRWWTMLGVARKLKWVLTYCEWRRQTSTCRVSNFMAWCWRTESCWRPCHLLLKFG